MKRFNWKALRLDWNALPQVWRVTFLAIGFVMGVAGALLAAPNELPLGAAKGVVVLLAVGILYFAALAIQNRRK